ncbi:MAG: hypothetical protein ACI89L_002467 [Phycisphaerales bacterium]|jgi:hypothetical protein
MAATATSDYDCTKPGDTRLRELHRATNDVARLTRFAATIATQWADAKRARPGDGAGGVIHPDGTEFLSKGETEESIEAARQAARDQAISWWAEWEAAVARLDVALQIEPPAKLRLDLQPASSALGRLIELFPRPPFLFSGEEPGDHLMRPANPFGVDRVGTTSFPEEAVALAVRTLSALVTALHPHQRSGYEWPGGFRGLTKTQLIEIAGAGGASLSSSKFDRIREAAGVAPSPLGRAAANRRFTATEIEAMIVAVERGDFEQPRQIAEAWAASLERNSGT